MTPSDALRLGLCPSCLGIGTVHKVVPTRHIGLCSSCQGLGTLQGMLDYLAAESLDRAVDVNVSDDYL